MGIIQRVFSRNGRNGIPADLIALSTGIQETIDDITNQVFSLYSSELLAYSVTYVVPAVWGADKDGELTGMQLEMNRLIAPAVDEAIEMFNFGNLSLQQEYAIRCMVCGLVVSRLILMVELAKNQGLNLDRASLDEMAARAAPAEPTPGS